MQIASALYGSGEIAASRAAAASTLGSALRTIVALDAALFGHPLRSPWIRLDHAVAGAAALRERGTADSDFAAILRARLGAGTLPRGHVGLGDLDDRARRWARASHRSGSAELRAMVAILSPRRGTCDLVDLADRIAYELSHIRAPSWSWQTGGSELVVSVSPAFGPDIVDLALAVPYAVRRIGVSRILLPSLSGRVRLFASETSDPLEQLIRWAATLQRQAADGERRLRLLERYTDTARAALGEVRRPAALRRLVGIGMNSWTLWAAQLARITGVDVSSAWRTLTQAAELGLVQVVPGQGRSRGNGTLYAIPPWLKLAGLIAAPRGRPGHRSSSSLPSGAEGLFAAMDAADAAMAEIDALMKRSSPP